MLEIFFLVWFCKKLAGIARDKNRGGGWGALGAIGWVGGEVGGFLIGASHAHDEMGAYGYGILGALVGAAVAWVIVRSLPDVPLDTGLPPARIV